MIFIISRIYQSVFVNKIYSRFEEENNYFQHLTKVTELSFFCLFVLKYVLQEKLT